MTTGQYSKLLDFYKAELAGDRNEDNIKVEYRTAILEKDRLTVNCIDTTDVTEYINELEMLI